MSQSVNISVCPFHRYMRTYGPHTRPQPLGYRPPWPPLCFRMLVQQRSLHSCISSWKRSRRPHDLLFEEDSVDTQSRPCTIQLQSTEIRHICWTLLWVIVCFSLGACKDPLTRLWWARKWSQQMYDKDETAVFNYGQHQKQWKSSSGVKKHLIYIDLKQRKAAYPYITEPGSTMAANLWQSLLHKWPKWLINN